MRSKQITPECVVTVPHVCLKTFFDTHCINVNNMASETLLNL